MNERIKELAVQAGIISAENNGFDRTTTTKVEEKFAELIIKECIGILESEIELVTQYKSTACNNFDIMWQQGKIDHFTKLVAKYKKHFGVE